MAFFQRNSNVVALYTVRCRREVANRVNANTLMNNVVSALASHNVTVSQGPRMSYAIMSENSIVSGFDWQIVLKFTCRETLDTTALNDWIAYAWNQTVGEGYRLPTDNAAHAGSLFAACSAWDTMRESSGGVLGSLWNTINPFSEPNYFMLCARFTQVDRLENATIGPAGTLDRLIANPVTSASSPELVGTDPSQSTDIAGLASDAASAASRSINSAIGGAGGEGVNSNDIKFFAYATIGIIGTLVLVKVLKEVKAI